MADGFVLNADMIKKAMADMKAAGLDYKPPLAYGGIGSPLPSHSHSGDAFSYAQAIRAAKQSAPDRFNHQAMEAMICSRMGWQAQVLTTETNTRTIPFREMRCAKLNDEKAVVWIIHNNTALTIEDDLNLFPSDALVTSLRLLLS